MVAVQFLGKAQCESHCMSLFRMSISVNAVTNDTALHENNGVTLEWVATHFGMTLLFSISVDTGQFKQASTFVRCRNSSTGSKALKGSS